MSMLFRLAIGNYYNSSNTAKIRIKNVGEQKCKISLFTECRPRILESTKVQNVVLHPGAIVEFGPLSLFEGYGLYLATDGKVIVDLFSRIETSIESKNK